jgi:hypothetical protein
MECDRKQCEDELKKAALDYKTYIENYLNQHQVDENIIQRFRNLTIGEIAAWFKTNVLSYCADEEVAYAFYVSCQPIIMTYSMYYGVNLPEFNREEVVKLYRVGVEICNLFSENAC